MPGYACRKEGKRVLYRGGRSGKRQNFCPSVLRRVCQDVRAAWLKPFANYLNISNARGFTSVFFYPPEFPSLNFPSLFFVGFPQSTAALLNRATSQLIVWDLFYLLLFCLVSFIVFYRVCLLSFIRCRH